MGESQAEQRAGELPYSVAQEFPSLLLANCTEHKVALLAQHPLVLTPAPKGLAMSVWKYRGVQRVRNPATVVGGCCQVCGCELGRGVEGTEGAESTRLGSEFSCFSPSS